MAPDGVAVAYEDEGAGRPLVLLHGLMAHSGFFMRQRELASSFRIVSVDLRGHGRSGRDGRAPTVGDLARDIVALVEHLDLQDAIGLGWSLGATVLWRVLTSPTGSRFAGAVVVDMTPRVLNSGDWQLGLSPELCDARTDAIRNDFAAFAQSAGHAIFAQPVREEALARWAGEEFARNDPSIIAALWSSLVEEDSRPLLPRVRQPTLIVRGAQSQLYGAGTADYLVRALPEATATEFTNSGHAPHLEQPGLFNGQIRSFAAALPTSHHEQTT